MFLPNMSIDGVSLVVACGVVRYLSKNALSFWFIDVESDSADLIACLNDCTKRSASPLVLGWNGADVMWRMPLDFKNSFISWEMNCGPLSDTISLGIPNRAKSMRNMLIVAEAVVEFIWNTSGHLLCESTTIKNMLFLNGPAKSICSLYHGWFGQSHGCTGAACGARCVDAQPLQVWTACSRSRSIFGHQT